VGTPAANDLTLAPGAGHGAEGDASDQGPAQERLSPLPEQPKPANPDTAISGSEMKSDSAPSSVIELAARIKKADAADASAAAPGGLVTVRPKPEKRKNARERAKEKIEKRNKDKFAKSETKDDTKNGIKDGTTPAMTATAKSEVATKEAAKSEVKRAAKAEAKAEAKSKKAKTKVQAKARAKAAKE
jgi:hypothetical protein